MKPGTLNVNKIDLETESVTDVADCRALAKLLRNLSEDDAVRRLIREIRAAETRGQQKVMRAAANAADHINWDSRTREALETKL